MSSYRPGVQRVPILLVGPTATLDSLPVAAQVCENMYSEANPDIVDAALRHGPGLESFCAIGGTPRGFGVVGGTLVAVFDTTAYAVSSTGVATSIGSISASARLSVTGNATTLVMTDGSSGWLVTTSAVTQITDADFPTAPGAVAFVDNYILAAVGGTAQFQWSDVGAPSAWDGLSFATAEGAPDRVSRLIANNREVWLFGESQTTGRASTEVWYNDGSTPFARNPGGFMERGIASPLSAATLDNSVLWQGDDGIVYRADGFRPVRISTHAIETQLRGVTDAYAFTMSIDGHPFYVLTAPGIGTFAYDASTALWCTFSSWGSETWRPIDITQCYGRQIAIGEGGLFTVSREIYTDNAEVIRKRRTLPPMWFEGRQFIVHKVGLEMDPGRGDLGGSPTIELELSSDQGYTWRAPKQRSIGGAGDYRRAVEWNSLGTFRHCLPRLTSTASVAQNWKRAWADIEVLAN